MLLDELEILLGTKVKAKLIEYMIYRFSFHILINYEFFTKPISINTYIKCVTYRGINLSLLASSLSFLTTINAETA